MAYLGPARARLPDESGVDFADPAQVKAYVASLVSALTQQLAQRPAISQARAGQLFVSPNGSAYELTVSDAGAPVFTLRSGPPP